MSLHAWHMRGVNQVSIHSLHDEAWHRTSSEPSRCVPRMNFWRRSMTGVPRNAPCYPEPRLFTALLRLRLKKRRRSPGADPESRCRKRNGALAPSGCDNAVVATCQFRNDCERLLEGRERFARRPVIRWTAFRGGRVLNVQGSAYCRGWHCNVKGCCNGT